MNPAFPAGARASRAESPLGRMERKAASPRIVTVARLARVSPSTVSRVMSGQGTVSLATRERVQKVIDHCGYQPDPMARGLRRKRSTYVMVLHVAGTAAVGHSQACCAFEVVEQIAEAVSTGGALVVFRRVDSLDRERLRCLAEQCGARSAVLVGRAPLVDCWAALAGAVPQLEVVEVDDGGIACHDVPMHERKGASAVARHLVDAGCSDVAYLGDARHPLGSARHAGFREGCGRTASSNRALQFDPDCGVSLVESLEGLVSGWQRADGLFAATDALALDALAALRELGLQVPGDVKLAAMGGTLAAARSVPPLTTLAPLAEAAITALVHRLCGEPPDAGLSEYLPEGSLIVRESSLPQDLPRPTAEAILGHPP